MPCFRKTTIFMKAVPEHTITSICGLAILSDIVPPQLLLMCHVQIWWQDYACMHTRKFRDRIMLEKIDLPGGWIYGLRLKEISSISVISPETGLSSQETERLSTSSFFHWFKERFFVSTAVCMCLWCDTRIFVYVSILKLFSACWPYFVEHIQQHDSVKAAPQALVLFASTA